MLTKVIAQITVDGSAIKFNRITDGIVFMPNITAKYILVWNGQRYLG
jgi:hypothetical protein